MSDEQARKRKGGRPKGKPDEVRGCTIGVRVSAIEHVALKAKAEQMGMTPAQWLREAALSRRLPSPPVAAVNRERYVELGKLAANINQLARAANAGGSGSGLQATLQAVLREVSALRLELIGAGGES